MIDNISRLILNLFKGAEVGNFGTFTWELKQQDGETLSRPIFLISNSFVKDHGIKRQRVHLVPSTANTEAINFSKLAIKFTKSLTKDIVFSCIRDIIKKIGDFVDRSYKFHVSFSFGTFSCHEKKIKFEFDYSRLSKVNYLRYDNDYTNF